MYTFEQLRDFVAVAEEQSFSKAAARLNMTQPPLSRQIQRLEAAVGFQLFVRTSRTVTLTPAGQIFLTEARRILQMADAAALMARRVARGTAGRIRVGFTAVAALNVFGDWIRAVHRELPDIDFVLTEMVSSVQVDALLAGEIDVGFMRGLPTSNVLAGRLAFSERFVVAVPDGHPLTELGRDPLLAEVAAYNIITYSPAPSRYFHELVVSLFLNAGHTTDYVQYVSQVNSQLVLVDAAIGIALVPRSASRLRPPRVRFLEIADLQEKLVELHCVWRADSTNVAMPAALSLLDRVVDEYEAV
ncbi:LysR family transcriptional regulator [Mycolicibacterium sp. XJ870]